VKPAEPAGFIMPGAVRPSEPRERRLAEAVVLAVVFLWAGNFVVVKAALEAVPPVGFTFLRYALAAVTLIALLRWREGDVRLPRNDIVPIAILGVIGFGIYQVLWTVGLETVPAGDSALIVASTPVLVAVLAVAAGSDVLTPARAVGALVSFAGVGLVVGADGLTVGSSVLGDLLTLGAAVCWAIYTAWGAPILRRHSALRTTAWTTVFGTLFLAPIGIGQLATAAGGGAMSLDAGIVVPVVAAIVYSGWLAAGFPNVALFHAVALLGPTRVTAFQFLVPAVTVVFAFVTLNEPIRVEQIVGGAVIVAGILVMRGTRPGRPISRIRGARRQVS
jgi:drug/metabolite transporter (DMT)-like permease